MTPEMLEKSYNVRAVVPEYLDIFADWQRRSQESLTRLPAPQEIIYGPGPREHLDLFSAGPGTPLLVYVHGGYWLWNDKAMFPFLVEPLVAAGISVALINYPQAPSVGVPEIIAAVRRAVAQAWRSAPAAGIDRDRLYVAGHSAGGHLAAWMLATDWAQVAPDLPALPVQGVAAISGLFDLRPLLSVSLNADLGLTAPVAEAASPLLARPASTVAPLLIAWGEDETQAFISQSLNFAAAWGGEHVPVTRLPLVGRNHFTVLEDLASPQGRLLTALCKMCRGGLVPESGS